MYANERWCYWSRQILIPLGAGVTSRSELQDMGARKRTRVPWVSSTLSCWNVSPAPPLISGVLFSFSPFPISLLSFFPVSFYRVPAGLPEAGWGHKRHQDQGFSSRTCFSHQTESNERGGIGGVGWVSLLNAPASVTGKSRPELEWQHTHSPPAQVQTYRKKHLNLKYKTRFSQTIPQSWM